MSTDFTDVDDLPLSEAEWVQAYPVEALKALAGVQPSPELLAALGDLGASWAQDKDPLLLPWYDQWPYDTESSESEWKPTEWRITDMLPVGGVTLLAGPGSAGKTHVGLQVAVNCALGNERAWMGTSKLTRKLSDNGPVVWVTWETSRGDYQKRLLAACDKGDLSRLKERLAFVDLRDAGPLFASSGRGAPPR